eukprot:6193762-Pleurochrysis_carterae.AAC.1
MRLTGVLQLVQAVPSLGSDSWSTHGRADESTRNWESGCSSYFVVECLWFADIVTMLLRNLYAVIGVALMMLQELIRMDVSINGSSRLSGSWYAKFMRIQCLPLMTRLHAREW